MTYDFSFDKKSIGALLTCSVALCVLLFFAGVLVGTGWGAKADSRAATQAATQAEGTNTAPHAQAQPFAAQPATAVAPVQSSTSSATLPQEPVLYDDPMRREYAAQGYGPQRYDPQGYDPRDYNSQGYGPQAQTPQTPTARSYPAPGANALAPQATDDGAQGFNGRREAERLRARGASADPRVVSEADDTEVSNAAPRTSGAQGYSVQVGAYLDERDARRLVGELESKGYTPIVFSGTDAEARVWYAVRIGAYTNVKDASQAANSFTRQERRKADVRPAGSL
jgi:hypothetical protein